ncbi:hypothetical protein Pcinc_011503 [Petrolisthes cinctipes]|uniref:Uncharacterized protein n=1 Tax=Petrolisthes cinctipes TaxID=88211 RepID=A0AAE1KUD0_PETCI|nr:hypothetical protein Pcinc_011503 [Petrolisthes cinctipes]
MATKRKMREEWLLNNEFRPWLRCVEADSTRARCITCKKEFGAELSTIKRHKASHMHVCNEARQQQGMDGVSTSKVSRKMFTILVMPCTFCHYQLPILMPKDYSQSYR